MNYKTNLTYKQTIMDNPFVFEFAQFLSSLSKDAYYYNPSSSVVSFDNGLCQIYIGLDSSLELDVSFTLYSVKEPDTEALGDLFDIKSNYDTLNDHLQYEHESIVALIENNKKPLTDETN